MAFFGDVCAAHVREVSGLRVVRPSGRSHSEETGSAKNVGHKISLSEWC